METAADSGPNDNESPPLIPGQLVGAWRTTFIVGWVGVIAGFGAVAQAGRLAGISPWWIGPETNPRNAVVFVLPFVAPIIAIVFAAMGSRVACLAGIGAALVSAAMALGDLDFPGIALVEVVVAAAGLAVTVACFAGRAVKPPALQQPAMMPEMMPASVSAPEQPERDQPR